jgi:hypothetical protein
MRHGSGGVASLVNLHLRNDGTAFFVVVWQAL